MTDKISAVPGDSDLRLQLRGLSKERELERDLWPDIQSGIRRVSERKTRQPWASLAMAACLALLAVLAVPLFVTPAENRDLKAHIVSSEVSAMDAEYQAALREFASIDLAPETKTQLRLLDDSASKIRQALEQSPQSTYLIPMLRRTYLQRLQITRRAIATNLA